MTDTLIKDLTAIAAGLGLTDEFEVQRLSSTTSTEKATFNDLVTLLSTLYALRASNLSDLADAPTSVVNIGASPKLFKTYVATRYYTPIGLVAGASAAVGTASRVFLFPFFVPQKITVSELFVRVATAQAGSNWQAAIYASGSDCMPTGSELAKSAVSAAATSGSTVVSSALAANVQLAAGTLYWMAFNTDANGAIATFGTLITAGDGVSASSLIGDTTLSNVITGGGSLLRGYYVNGITLGTWGNLGSSFTPVTSNFIPLIGFKVASVP